MGFGGRVSLIGCKVGALTPPAGEFLCLCCLLLGISPSGRGARCQDRRDHALALSGRGDPGRAWPINLVSLAPDARWRSAADEEQVRSLKVGDVVLVVHTGAMPCTILMTHEPPVDLRGAIIYHCGPVVAKDGNGWRVTAAGPTTSIREEPYQGDIIKRFGVRAVIGKGGMGGKRSRLSRSRERSTSTLSVARLSSTPRTIKNVDGVSLMEFGTPEAMWLTIEDFPRSRPWMRTATASTKTSSRNRPGWPPSVDKHADGRHRSISRPMASSVVTSAEADFAGLLRRKCLPAALRDAIILVGGSWQLSNLTNHQPRMGVISMINVSPTAATKIQRAAD